MIFKWNLSRKRQVTTVDTEYYFTVLSKDEGASFYRFFDECSLLV